MSKEKLPLCPHCNSKAEFGYSCFGPVSKKADMEFHSINCTNLKCLASVTQKTKAQARKAWDRRVK